MSASVYLFIVLIFSGDNADVVFVFWFISLFMDFT